LKICRLSIVVILCALGAIRAAGQAPIALGIVREDGNLFPITLVTPKLFEEPRFPSQTTVNGEQLDAPARPASPNWPFKDAAWTLSAGRGRGALAINTLKPVMVPMPYCADQLMWRTNLSRPPVREGHAPIRKLGAAATGVSLELPEDVTSRVDARVARRIVSVFLTKEKERLSGEQEPYVRALAADAQPVVIRQLMRHRVGDVIVYYFEATKALKLADGILFPDVGLVTGWIADSPSGLQDHEVRYKINDDAAKQNDRAIVRGIIPYQGKALWLLEWHGWESEYYTLHDWPSGAVRLTVDAYNCS
jgi:hypothetical protein